MSNKINPILATDAYKLGHMVMMDVLSPEIDYTYTNMTPRSMKYFNNLVPEKFIDNKIVVFGIEMFVKDLAKSFDNFFKQDEYLAVSIFEQFAKPFVGGNKKALEISKSKIRALHKLGYLPIKIKALEEGTVSNPKVPILTTINTVPGFAWLPNYLEDLISQSIWKPSTVATVSRMYRKIFTHYAELTCDDNMHLEFQGHDFSSRGMANLEDSAKCGLAHGTQSSGSDGVYSVYNGVMNYNYHLNNSTDILYSVAATEHSIMCLGIALYGETETFRKLLKFYDTGIIAIVSDTDDYWNTITVIASELKDDILSRKPDEIGLCKTVFRPDSGNPIDVICGNPYATEGTPEHKGSLEILWEIFSGTVNSKGYRVLNPKVGLIYGDSITMITANAILERMEQMKFASSNIVFGIGSYAYNYHTRDTLGYAIKATASIKSDGTLIPLQKTVKTDTGKKSAKGLLCVDENLELIEDCTIEQEQEGMLKLIFEDSYCVSNEIDFDKIRQRARS